MVRKNGLPALLTPPAFNIHFFFPIQASTDELFKLSRSYASTYWLSPHEYVWKDAILISTPTKNYTATAYEELFTDAGYPQGYTQISEFDVDWPVPNVPTYCFYSLGSPTPLTYVYGDGFPSTQPTQIIYGDGDGVVNKPSLEVVFNRLTVAIPSTAQSFLAEITLISQVTYFFSKPLDILLELQKTLLMVSLLIT